MKNLELKQIGINELSLTEIKQTTGGRPLSTAAGGGILTYVVGEILTGIYQAYKNDFECSCE